MWRLTQMKPTPWLFLSWLLPQQNKETTNGKSRLTLYIFVHFSIYRFHSDIRFYIGWYVLIMIIFKLTIIAVVLAWLVLQTDCLTTVILLIPDCSYFIFTDYNSLILTIYLRNHPEQLVQILVSGLTIGFPPRHFSSQQCCAPGSDTCGSARWRLFRSDGSVYRRRSGGNDSRPSHAPRRCNRRRRFWEAGDWDFFFGGQAETGWGSAVCRYLGWLTWWKPSHESFWGLKATSQTMCAMSTANYMFSCFKLRLLIDVDCHVNLLEVTLQ